MKYRDAKKVEMRDLLATISAATHGSFHNGSILLGVGQPSLSRRVQRLEDKIGVSLFERSSTSVTLTPAGYRFLGRAQEFLQDIELMVEEARHAGAVEHGELRIGVSVSLSGGPFRRVIREFF